MFQLFGPHYDPYKCKVQLKLAVSRIQILKTKKANLVRDEKRHISELLRNRNEESARIRVETVIADESLIECYNIIEVLCETVFSRIQLINCSDEIPTELKESIYTLVYASQRVQVPELELIRKQLCAKYGKALENEVNCHCQAYVNPKIIHKLSYSTPEPFLIFQYLNDIACQFKVDWCVEPIQSPVSPNFVPMTQQPPQMMYAVPVGAQIQQQPPPSVSVSSFPLPPPSMNQHNNSNMPPPFPTLIAPQHYNPNPPPYTPHNQNNQNNNTNQPQQHLQLPTAPVNRTVSSPQFPSPPSYNSTNLSFSTSAKNNNFNSNVPYQPPPPNYQQQPQQPPPPMQYNQFPSAPMSHPNDDPNIDFDELTARFDSLKKQNNNRDY